MAFGATSEYTILLKAKDEASKALSGFSSKLGNIGALAGGAALAGVAALGAGILKMTSDAAALEPTRITFDNLTKSIGSTADKMLDKLRPATMGIVSDADLMAASNKLMNMGLADSEDSAAGLAEMAVKLGVAMGKDAKGAMEDFTLMLANQSIPRLDTFGISSGKVRERIAELQKETAGMSREQAFMIATLEQGAESMERVGDVSGTSSVAMQRIQSSMKNVTDQAGAAFLPILAKLLVPLGDLAQRYGPLVVEWAEKFATRLGELATEYGPSVMNVITAIWNVLNPLSQILFKIGQEVLGNIVIPALGWLWDKLKLVWDVLEPIRNAFSTFGKAIAGVFGIEIPDASKEAADSMLDFSDKTTSAYKQAEQAAAVSTESMIANIKARTVAEQAASEETEKILQKIAELQEDYGTKRARAAEDNALKIAEATRNYQLDMEREQEDHQLKLVELGEEYQEERDGLLEDQLEKREGLTADHLEKLAEYEEDFNKRVADLTESFYDNLAEMQSDFEDTMADKGQDYQDKRADMEKDRADTLADHQGDYQDKVTDMTSSFQKRLAKLEEEGAEERIEELKAEQEEKLALAEREHQQWLERSERDHQDRVDIAEREHQQNVERAEREYAQRLVLEEKQHQESIAKLTQDRDERRAESERQHAQDMEQLESNLQERLAKEEDHYKEIQAKTEESYELARQRRQEDQVLKMSDMAAAQEQSMQRMAEDHAERLDELQSQLDEERETLRAGSFEAGTAANEGLAQGIDATAYLAANAAKKSAQGVINATNEVFETGSASRVMIRIANDVMDGLEMPIVERGPEILNTVKGLGVNMAAAAQGIAEEWGITSFARGGVVPGRPGTAVPILAHAGERVIPTGRSGGGLTIHIGSVYGTDRAAARNLSKMIAEELRRKGVNYVRA